jgi:orotidine-5'-phosphate decarboxylase
MKPLIVALDVDTEKEALSLIKATKAHVDLYKVGPTLVLRYGPQIFKSIKRAGRKVFLDLKFHDIPNTMLRSVQEAGDWNIYSATVHTSAGENALKTVAQTSHRPKIWGVTVLTSMTAGDLSDLGFQRSTMDQVMHLAATAKRAGLDGVVASVGETAELARQLGKNFTIVTPGIRLPENNVGDQKRVATPAHARAAGSHFIVVGRPIIESRDPGDMAEQILRDWKKGGV